MHDQTILRVFANACDATVLNPEDDEATVIVEHGSRGPQGPRGFEGIGSSFQTFSGPGTLLVVTGMARFYALEDMTIDAVSVSCGNPPTGSSIVVDINRNGSTIYTNQANRPTITANNYLALATTPDITTLNQGDYLTVDIDQVGLVYPGSDLAVTIKLSEV